MTMKVEQFQNILTEQYKNLFATDPEYAYAKNRMSPEDLAQKMTTGLINGTANKDGEGIKRTCKQLAIKHTDKAIREFLTNPNS